MAVIEQRFIPKGTGIRRPKTYMVLVPKGMCWHWTANTKPGAGAKNHWKYWHSAEDGAHYVVDDHDTIQCCPDTEIVWHAGGGITTVYARSKYPAGTNGSLISTEMCVNSDGDWNETYRNAVYLGAVKCLEYGWDPARNFERHYDCTGKDCPRMWTPFVTNGETAWKQFINEVSQEMKRIKGGETVEPWKAEIMKQSIENGLINSEADHKPDEPATKWFVLVVALNIIKAVKSWKAM